MGVHRHFYGQTIKLDFFYLCIYLFLWWLARYKTFKFREIRIGSFDALGKSIALIVHLLSMCRRSYYYLLLLFKKVVFFPHFHQGSVEALFEKLHIVSWSRKVVFLVALSAVVVKTNLKTLQLFWLFPSKMFLRIGIRPKKNN